MSDKKKISEPKGLEPKEAPVLEEILEERSWSDFPTLKDFFKGLASPRTSGEYRRSRLAIERLQAPVIAVLVPVLLVASIFIVTATVQTSKKKIEIEIAQAQEVDDLEPVEDEPPPEDVPDMVTVDPDAPIVDVSFDVPTPTIAPPSSGTPGGGPVSPVKGVQGISSPVTARIVSRGPGTRSLGEGSDFGVNIGSGSGSGGGGIPSGYMIGEMFDFKRDAAGNDIAGWNPGMYWAQARKVINDGKFGAEAEKDVYKVPAKVALNKIWIPNQSAENGPTAFAVGDKMKPRGWMAHYSASLKAKVGGRFRFIGEFDDFMACFVDGKLVLEVNWAYYGDKPTHVFGWKSPIGKTPYGIDVVGDWFEIKKGQVIRFDICVGECPGGMIQGRLMIEQEGAEYKKDGNRPIWPLFTSRRLSFKELERIRENNEKGGFKFAEELSSLFKLEEEAPASKKDGKGKKSAVEDLQIEVSI